MISSVGWCDRQTWTLQLIDHVLSYDQNEQTSTITGIRRTKKKRKTCFINTSLHNILRGGHELLDFKKYFTLPAVLSFWVLSISTLSSLFAVNKRGHLARGKTDAMPDVDGPELKRQCSESHHTNAFPPSGKLVTATLELRRFHVSI